MTDIFTWVIRNVSLDLITRFLSSKAFDMIGWTVTYLVTSLLALSYGSPPILHKSASACTRELLERIQRPIRVGSEDFQQIEMCLVPEDHVDLYENGIEEIWYFGEKIPLIERLKLRQDPRDNTVPDMHIGFRYRILDKIGQGHFSNVYEVIDMKTHKRAVIKMASGYSSTNNTEAPRAIA